MHLLNLTCRLTWERRPPGSGDKAEGNSLGGKGGLWLPLLASYFPQAAGPWPGPQLSSWFQPEWEKIVGEAGTGNSCRSGRRLEELGSVCTAWSRPPWAFVWGLLHHPCPGLRCTCRLLDVAGSCPREPCSSHCGRTGGVSFLSSPPLSDSPSGSLDDARERVDGYQQRLSLGFVPFHLLLVGAEPQHLGLLGPGTRLWTGSNLKPDHIPVRAAAVLVQ